MGSSIGFLGLLFAESILGLPSLLLCQSLELFLLQSLLVGKIGSTLIRNCTVCIILYSELVFLKKVKVFLVPRVYLPMLVSLAHQKAFEHLLDNYGRRILLTVSNCPNQLTQAMQPELLLYLGGCLILLKALIATKLAKSIQPKLALYFDS